jgi:hypothetical protein
MKKNSASRLTNRRKWAIIKGKGRFTAPGDFYAITPTFLTDDLSRHSPRFLA